MRFTHRPYCTVTQSLSVTCRYCLLSRAFRYSDQSSAGYAVVIVYVRYCTLASVVVRPAGSNSGSDSDLACV